MANSEQVIQVNMNTDGVKSATEELDKELLVLRLSLGKLRVAIINAAAPLGAALLPALQKAVWAATRLVNKIGKVINALFGYSSASKNTAKAQEKLTHANEKVKKSLMGFDEINRLDTADSTETEDSPEPAANDTLTPQLQGVVDKILSLTAPLKEIDFSPAVAAFGRLKAAISPITQTLFSGLEWAWHNLLVPLAAWTIEDLLPVFLNTLTSAFGVLNAVLIALRPLGDWLWESFLKPLGEWTGELILQALQWLAEKLDKVSQWIQNNRELVEGIALTVGKFAIAWLLANGALGTWNTLSKLATVGTSAFGGAMGFLNTPIKLITGAIGALIVAIVVLVKNWDTVKAVAIGVWESIKTAWAGAWSWFREKIIDPLTNGFKNMVNGIIGFLNALIGGVVSGVNGIVAVINKLSFQVPDWVPGLGGKSLGFQLNTVSTPQIPYLAKGAVLPANKPFLAVVGDQRNGTNVEAPLETIKHALSEVLALQDIGGETVVQVNFTGDLAQLARVLKPAIATETRRKGMSLAKGAV